MSDEAMIRRAIALAMQGRGGVEPNPMVGCVIVKNGCIIGEGWHQKYGQAHAEPNALAACAESPEGATAYVTLEPCCHTNKQTPPCVPRLVAAKVSRVVIGCLDPNPQVSGRGVQQLRDAGIVVDVNICEPACRQLIAPYYVSQYHGRPYITLKWAQTRDGKVAGPGGTRLQITGPAANEAVHDLRSRCDAILVGVNTVLCDDPILTTRGRANARTLLRVVLDRQLRTPITSRLVQTATNHELMICCSPVADNSRAAALTAAGVHVEQVEHLIDIMTLLNARRVSHLLVEPGPTLATAFFRQHLADRLWNFSSRTTAGEGPAAADIPADYVTAGQRSLATDMLTEYLNPNSPAFFSPETSADLVMTLSI